MRLHILPVKVYGKFIPLATFKFIQGFFLKNFSFFEENAKSWKFWEILIFESHLTANLGPAEISKGFKIFFEKPINFLKNRNFWTFWQILLFQSPSTVNLLPSGFLKKVKILSANPTVITKEPKIGTFWEFSLIPLPSTESLLPLILLKLKNFWVFFQKNHLFSEEISKSEHFESSRHSSHAHRQICYLQRYLETGIFFRKTNLFSQKKLKIWTFWEFFLFQAISTASLIL